MSVLVLDGARNLPRAAAQPLPSQPLPSQPLPSQPLPSEAARASAVVKRVMALAAISLALCSIPSDGGPARTTRTAAVPHSLTLLGLLRNADR